MTSNRFASVLIALSIYAVLVITYAAYASAAVTVRHHETSPYCIDPWTSNDMRERTYTPCARIPYRWKA